MIASMDTLDARSMFNVQTIWRAPVPSPPPPSPPAVVGAPLGAEGADDEGSEGGAGGDDDDDSEKGPESSSSSSSSDDDDDEDAACIQRGIDEVLSCHIAEFDLSGVPEGVSKSDPPPELDLGPPPPAAPAVQPSKCDASTLTEPVLPHTLQLDATPVASTPQSDLPPLDASPNCFA